MMGQTTMFSTCYTDRRSNDLVSRQNCGLTGTQGLVNHHPGRFDQTILSTGPTFPDDLPVGPCLPVNPNLRKAKSGQKENL
jgi:hypothetical protein